MGIFKKYHSIIPELGPMLINPVNYRDMLIIMSGYTKEKANEIVVELYLKQGNLKEDIVRLKEQLDG